MNWWSLLWNFCNLYNFVDPNHVKRIESHRLCRALTWVGIMQRIQSHKSCRVLSLVKIILQDVMLSVPDSGSIGCCRHTWLKLPRQEWRRLWREICPDRCQLPALFSLFFLSLYLTLSRASLFFLVKWSHVRLLALLAYCVQCTETARNHFGITCTLPAVSVRVWPSGLWRSSATTKVICCTFRTSVYCICTNVNCNN